MFWGGKNGGIKKKGNRKHITACKLLHSVTPKQQEQLIFVWAGK